MVVNGERRKREGGTGEGRRAFGGRVVTTPSCPSGSYPLPSNTLVLRLLIAVLIKAISGDASSVNDSCGRIRVVDSSLKERKQARRFGLVFASERSASETPPFPTSRLVPLRVCALDNLLLWPTRDRSKIRNVRDRCADTVCPRRDSPA